VNDSRANEPQDEKPPFFGAWRDLYIFVLIYLAAVIFLFWLFTRRYAPPS
jgi:hypothetical protein